MTREQIVKIILGVLRDEFEIEDPDLNDNLTEKYEFDSIDAISLIEFIEDEMIRAPLTQEEKKQAMEIRSINQICDYIELLLKNRS